MGKLSVSLYGHIRTYQRTYESFLKNIIEINQKDGWEIDIFIHTWNVWNITDPNVWHKNQNCFPTMSNKKLSEQDKLNFISTYKPVRYLIDEDTRERGRYESIKRVALLREEYEKEHNITYDYFLVTRPDLLFIKPLRINEYLNIYNVQPNLKAVGMPAKVNFVASWHFRDTLLPVLDSRFPNESDLLWFGNYASRQMAPLNAFRDKSIVNIFIRYRFNMEFIQVRETTKEIDYKVLVSKNDIEKAKNLQNSSNQAIAKLKQTFSQSAKQRIHSHLAYKLGSAMILNSKSLWGYMRMPYVLSFIKESHRKEIADYEKKVAKNPKLKLPPLESYADYEQALKEKECFTYQLGKALITANSVRGGGGNICLSQILSRSA